MRTRSLAWACLVFVGVSSLYGQSNSRYQQNSVSSRFRSIDAPSAVDSYRSSKTLSSPSIRRTVYQPPIAPETNPVRLAQFESPPLPNTAQSQNGANPNGMALPSTNPARALPLPSERVDRIESASDYSSVPQPRLNNDRYATIDNSRCVSAPSGYVASAGYVCGSPGSCQTYAPPAAQLPTSAVLPSGVVVPQQGIAPIRPLLSFGQERNAVQVGQGILGQPVAYVPGQGVRNFIRYLFP